MNQDPGQTRLCSKARILHKNEIDALLAYPTLACLATARENKPHFVPCFVRLGRAKPVV